MGRADGRWFPSGFAVGPVQHRSRRRRGAGLGAVVFRYLIYFFTWLATGHVQFGQQGYVGSSSPAVAGAGVLRGHPGHRRADLRPADLPVRPRSPRAWRAGGDAGGRRERRPDPSAGQRGQGASPPRCASAPAGRWAARARSCRSARRWRLALGQWIRDAGEPAADPGRLRRGRRDLRDLQRADHRGVLRGRDHPARVLRRLAVHGDALRDGRRRGGDPVPGQPALPVRVPGGYRPAPSP